MKTLGIIGGVGPGSTAEFYLQVSYGCQKRNEVQRPGIIVGSVPAPYDVERDMILNNINRYTPLLVTEAVRLQNAGADFLALPCNTLHCDIDIIRNAVSIPVISIVDSAAAYINEKAYKKIGLLATAATAERRIYSKIFDKNNIDYVLPEKNEQTGLNKLIVNLVVDKYLDEDRKFLHKYIDNMINKGVDCIALACTDLQLMKPEKDRNDIPIFDTMAVLADAVIDEILS